MPNLLKKGFSLKKRLPISIRRSSNIKSHQCEFTIAMSHDMAEQLSLIAAPFLRDLCKAVEQRKRVKASKQRVKLRLEDASKEVRWIGLKTAHMARKTDVYDLYSICEEMALLSKLDPKSVYCAANNWSEQRRKQVTRFSERRIIQLYKHEGWKKRQLAKQFRTSVHNVRRILGELPPREA